MSSPARDAAWESAWLIERPSDEPGRPRYWVEAVAAPGLGSWTQDPWQATRYATKADADREIGRWLVHPVVLDDVKAVEHGFG